MCRHPISIPNPNYGSKIPFIKEFRDTTSKRIYINCGHCDQCIRSKQVQMIQRVQMEAEKSHVFMIMLSYNERNLPRITASDGTTFKYAKTKHIQDMMKRLREHGKIDRNIRYIFTSEYGGKKHRPHWHGILLLPKLKTDTPWTPINLEYTLKKEILKEWTINKGSTRAPIYDNLLDFHTIYKYGKLYSNYDLHYVTPDKNGENIQAAFYVLKYMMKDDSYTAALHKAIKINYANKVYIDEDGKERTEADKLWKELRTKTAKSIAFGTKGKREYYIKDSGIGYTYKTWKIIPNKDIEAEIKKMINLSYNGMDMPCYFNKTTGANFPLAGYYKKKFMTLCDHRRFNKTDEEGNFQYREDPELEKRRNEIKKDEELYAKRLKKMKEYGDCLDIFDIEE